ncbi:hypothetical protein DFH11DRAFT_1877367 [Phellopilus nigrolimitatus]|nr:hypothetical protein DFH11DRAFT_1877367 [Phellopilus nigrolimitatus]
MHWLKKTMLVGMDLTHPGVGCTIIEVKQMMVERLNGYLKHMKTLPERVVVFRGGRFALSRATVPSSPTICGKQHPTHFYPTRPEQAGKTSNKDRDARRPGVTAVYNFDFFLQAYVGQQGTIRAHQRAWLYLHDLYLHEILPPPPDSRESAMDEAQILRRAKELWGTGSMRVFGAPVIRKNYVENEISGSIPRT